MLVSTVDNFDFLTILLVQALMEVLILTWHVTASVWHIWVFPVRNSPKISVIEPVSIPPPRSLSSSFDPVVTWTISDRFWWNSVAVVKPIGTSFPHSVCKCQIQLLQQLTKELHNRARIGKLDRKCNKKYNLFQL